MRGGSRPGAGRPKGALNRATIENKANIEELARAHTDDALKALASIVVTGQSETARIAAATALLDRGYGKPRQTVEAMVDGSISSDTLQRAEERFDRLLAGLSISAGTPSLQN